MLSSVKPILFFRYSVTDFSSTLRIVILLINMTPVKIISYTGAFIAGIGIGLLGYKLLSVPPSSPHTTNQTGIVVTPSTTEPTSTTPTPTEDKKLAIEWTGCSPKAIDIVEPEVGSTVSFPLTLKAIVNNGKNPDCRWTVFEAQAASIVAKTMDGTVVARGILQTEENWMTDGAISFEAHIEALKDVTPTGRLNLVITEEDPSGQGNAETITIPVIASSPSDQCALKPETGNCKAAITKYYFDQPSGTCKTFIWGGCGGVVPFEDSESCENACVSP